MADGSVCWYRIETGPDGKVVDIRAVDHAEQDGSQVFFVQARSAKEAARRAWNAYCRVRQQRRRAELVELGNCAWCARPNDRGPWKRCSVCLENARKYDERHRAKVAGVPVEPLDPKKTLAAKRDEDRDRLRAEVRLETLRSVHRHWLASQGNKWAFADWLLQELGKLTEPKKEVA